MNKYQRWLICLGLIGLVLSAVQPILTQTARQHISGQPDMGEGFNLKPVVVTSVATEALTSTITAVRIENISSKEVMAVRLGWVLTTTGTPLLTGKTGIVPTKNFLPHTSIVVKLPVLSVLDVQQQLSAKGITGDLSAVISTSDILFSDESTWKTGDKVAIEKSVSSPQLVRTAYELSAKGLTVGRLVPSVECAKQECKFADGPPPGYTCASSTEDQFCTNCGTTCCNTICGSQPACDCH